jgi:YVTN family beta-propeller protein
MRTSSFSSSTSIRFLTLAFFVVFGAGAASAQVTAYVGTDDANGTVLAIDTATNTVTATIPLEGSPMAIAATPNGAFVYVATGDKVSVIDTSTDTVVDTVRAGAVPFAIAMAPDGAFAYSTDLASPDLSVIDTARNRVVARIPLPSFGYELAVSPDGAFVYASGSDVHVIDTATRTVVANIPLPMFSPGQIAFTPDGAFAYVCGFSAVYVIDTTTHAISFTIPVDAYYIAMSADGTSAFVASSAVSEIDTATNTVTATTPVGNIFSLAITPDAAFAYVTTNAPATVTAIDTATNTVTATIPLAGTNPSGIAILTKPTPGSGPTSTDQCKNGGWQSFTGPAFKSQGDCISYVN